MSQIPNKSLKNPTNPINPLEMMDKFDNFFRFVDCLFPPFENLYVTSDKLVPQGSWSSNWTFREDLLFCKFVILQNDAG